MSLRVYEISDTDYREITDEVVSVSLAQIEGQVADLTLVRKQNGLRHVLGFETRLRVTYTPEGGTEKVIAVGYVDSLPSQLFTPRQTIKMRCARTNITDSMIAYGMNNLRDAPFWEPLVSDCKEDDHEAFLLGRPGFWHVDPATHAISVIDELEGSVTVNLTGRSIHDDGAVDISTTAEFGQAVQIMRGRVTFGWTQEAEGFCDVSEIISGVETLDSGFASNPSQGLKMNDSEGWTASFDEVVARATTSGSFNIGIPGNDIHNYGTVQNATTYEVEKEVDGVRTKETITADVHLQKYYVQFGRLPLRFSVSREREEVVEAQLQMGVQEGAFSRYQNDDFVEISTADLFEENAIRKYQTGKDYAVGDIVYFNGRRYVCTKAHNATSFFQPSGRFEVRDSFFGVAVRVPKPCWRAIPDDRSELHPGTGSIQRTDVGKRVLHHLFMRLLKEGRRRMRALRVPLRFAMRDAWFLSLKHSVEFELFDGVDFVPVVGKVVKVTHDFPEYGPPMVDIEVGIAVGKDVRRITGNPPPTNDGGSPGGSGSVGIPTPPRYFAERYVSAPYDYGTATAGGVLFRASGQVLRVASDDGVSTMSVSSSADNGISGNLEPSNGGRDLDLDVSGLRKPDGFTVEVRGSVAQQLSAGRTIAFAGGDVRECVGVKPTQVVITPYPVSLDTKKLTDSMMIEARVMDSPGGLRIGGEN